METIKRNEIDKMWGKVKSHHDENGEVRIEAWHPLEYHCLDVAMCLGELLNLPYYSRLIGGVAHCDVTNIVIDRLCAVAFLHDIGKGNAGFQSQIFNKQERGNIQRAGHLSEAIVLLDCEKFTSSPYLVEMDSWFQKASDENDSSPLVSMLFACWSHHGRPMGIPQNATCHAQKWKINWKYAGLQATTSLFFGCLTRWFPRAFEKDNIKILANPQFQALFCGLLTLADWIGSDVRMFSYTNGDTENYFAVSRNRAKKAICDLCLNPAQARNASYLTPKTFLDVFSFSPNGIQETLENLAKTYDYKQGTVALLESETGSGKTEAALAYAMELYTENKIDGVYFALPTRTSGVQMHSRVEKAFKQKFGPHDPPVVLAIPGYLVVNESVGVALPNWETKWDEDIKRRGWAAENSKRYLASPVAVGTVDQALMSILKVKHAHMRFACLSRSLLVIDEVHASDTYMSALARELIKRHTSLGGHALLMSATLAGEQATFYMGGTKPSFKEAMTSLYPLIRISEGPLVKTQPQVIPYKGEVNCSSKEVEIEIRDRSEDDEYVANKAIEFANCGARVLIIRNTVASCINVRRYISLQNPDVCMSVNGLNVPHHGRFHAYDRKILDVAVTDSFGKTSLNGPKILVATQTVEQSLDIDADALITDICPIDVLLQRIGRLHRHLRVRPRGFEMPLCVVLSPSKGIISALKKPIMGIGKDRAYDNVACVQLTDEILKKHPKFEIPVMNRYLVESCLHSESMNSLIARDSQWEEHIFEIRGRQFAQKTHAMNAVFPVMDFYGNDNAWDENDALFKTRLGQSPIEAFFDKTCLPKSPLNGRIIESISIPIWMVDKSILTENKEFPDIIAAQKKCGFSFECCGSKFVYTQDGLEKIKDGKNA
jgi:CRISPR-associated endonuclease/helicase Cas3